MTIEDNKALVIRFVEEFWSSGNESAADTLMADGVSIVVNNDPVKDTDRAKGVRPDAPSCVPRLAL